MQRPEEDDTEEETILPPELARIEREVRDSLRLSAQQDADESGLDDGEQRSRPRVTRINRDSRPRVTRIPKGWDVAEA